MSDELNLSVTKGGPVKFLSNPLYEEKKITNPLYEAPVPKTGEAALSQTRTEAANPTKWQIFKTKFRITVNNIGKKISGFIKNHPPFAPFGKRGDIQSRIKFEKQSVLNLKAVEILAEQDPFLALKMTKDILKEDSFKKPNVAMFGPTGKATLHEQFAKDLHRMDCIEIGPYIFEKKDLESAPGVEIHQKMLEFFDNKENAVLNTQVLLSQQILVPLTIEARLRAPEGHLVIGLEKHYKIEKRKENIHLTITTSFAIKNPEKEVTFAEASINSYIGAKVELIIPEVELKQKVNEGQDSTIPSLRVVNLYTTLVEVETKGKAREEIIKEGQLISDQLREKLDRHSV